MNSSIGYKLCEAALIGDLHTLNEILDDRRRMKDRGVDINIDEWVSNISDHTGYSGLTPIMASVCHLSCLRRLIEAGADIESSNDGVTALMLAAEYHANDSLVELINAGADLDRICMIGCSPAMAFAVGANNVKGVKILIDAGADIKKALDWAKKKGDRPECLKLLEDANKIKQEALEKLYNPFKNLEFKVKTAEGEVWKQMPELTDAVIKLYENKLNPKVTFYSDYLENSKDAATGKNIIHYLAQGKEVVRRVNGEAIDFQELIKATFEIAAYKKVEIDLLARDNDGKTMFHYCPELLNDMVKRGCFSNEDLVPRVTEEGIIEHGYRKGEKYKRFTDSFFWQDSKPASIDVFSIAVNQGLIKFSDFSEKVARTALHLCGDSSCACYSQGGSITTPESAEKIMAIIEASDLKLPEEVLDFAKSKLTKLSEKVAELERDDKLYMAVRKGLETDKEGFLKLVENFNSLTKSVSVLAENGLAVPEDISKTKEGIKAKLNEMMGGTDDVVSQHLSKDDGMISLHKTDHYLVSYDGEHINRPGVLASPKSIREQFPEMKGQHSPTCAYQHYGIAYGNNKIVAETLERMKVAGRIIPSTPTPEIAETGVLPQKALGGVQPVIGFKG